MAPSRPCAARAVWRLILTRTRCLDPSVCVSLQKYEEVGMEKKNNFETTHPFDLYLCDDSSMCVMTRVCVR